MDIKQVLPTGGSTRTSVDPVCLLAFSAPFFCYFRTFFVLFSLFFCFFLFFRTTKICSGDFAPQRSRVLIGYSTPIRGVEAVKIVALLIFIACGGGDFFCGPEFCVKYAEMGRAKKLHQSLCFAMANCRGGQL